MKARDKKCLCLDVRNLFGSHNLKIGERKTTPRRLTDKAQANRLGFFRHIASSRNGLRSRPTRLPLSTRVARDIDRRPPVATFARLSPKVSGVSAHNPSPGYYVVGLPIAIRKGTFRFGEGTKHEKSPTFSLHARSGVDMRRSPRQGVDSYAKKPAGIKRPCN
jgi:hypothetical protein